MMPLHRLVIAGLPRSGTTLLASLLNQQEGCRFITDYVAWFRDARERLEVDWNEPLGRAERRVCLAMARDSWIRLKHPVLVSTDDFGTLNELHLAIARELATEATVAVGHKALLDAEHIEACVEQTEIEVIVAVRDPRAAALSYWHRVGDGGVEPYLRDWKRVVRLCSRSRNNRLHLIRYEDLVGDPLRTLARLISWDAEARLPTALSFQRSSDASTPWSENSAFGDVRQLVDPTPLTRWRKDASSPVVRYADVTCRREMRALGYEPLGLGLSDRARFRAHEAYWRADARIDAAFRSARERLRRTLAPKISHRSVAGNHRDDRSC
jgi:hypothetical protein